MKKEALVSIIIPVYNVEKYINKCLDSVINQTYENIEILLVDDGSTDSSGKICDDYLKKDKRIKVFHKKNGGLSDARNYGVDNASGKYITFIDSDDDVEYDYVEYLYNLIKDNDAEMSICSCSVVTKKKIINYGINQKDRLYGTEECIIDMILCNGFTVSAWAKMYDYNKIKKIKYPIGKINEDNGTTYKFILQHNRIAYGHISKYHYYRRPNSIMTSNFSEKKLDLIYMTDQMCDELEKKYSSIKNITNCKRVEARFSVLRMIAESKNRKRYNNLIKKLKKYIKSNKRDFLNVKTDKIKKIFAYYSLMIGFPVFKIFWIIFKRKKYGD